MICSRLRRIVFGGTLAATWLVPAMAVAAEAAEEAASVEDAGMRALAAGLAIGLAALGAGFAQARVGSAGAGALAERPELAVWVITLMALPEIIVLLGFVGAILLAP